MELLPNFAPILLAAIRNACHVAVLTGAGVSAESGIPTFRDAQTGLWSRFRPEELASRDAFARNPKLVWDWYQWRRGLVAAAQPNAAHRALVTLAQRVPRFTLITQNVDGLHTSAGSTNVIELHGNIGRDKCFDREAAAHLREDRACAVGDDAPRCLTCGGWVRPDVVWFGETLPAGALTRADAAASSADVFFSIGTAAVVYPAAALPIQAVRAGKILVEINQDATPLSAATPYSYRGAAGAILPALLAAL